MINDDDFIIVEKMIKRARLAMKQIEHYSQEQIDLIVKSVAWAIYEDSRAKELAEIAVKDTKLGNVKDKILKNQRKTLGTLNDLMSVKTTGMVDHDPETGLTKYAKPVGVVCSLTPSTNPAATPVNQAMMAIKGANAIIISPSPTGANTAYKLADFIHGQLNKIKAPRGLFQVMPQPINFSKASALMELSDLVLVTGDQANVRKGYSSGKPCIGVGKGNVPVIIEKSADLEAAAQKIASSKTFDNATSCSSENAVVIEEEVYDQFLEALQRVGAKICSTSETRKVEDVFSSDGKINRNIIGKDVSVLSELMGIEIEANTKFLAVEQRGIGKNYPLSGEKLSLILSVYKGKDFDNCVKICNDILEYEGIGHSVGLHTRYPEMGQEVAERLKVARVLVNQAHTFGNGGGFNNSLPFTLSMGCGTWAGNSISENLSVKDFINTTTLVTPIKEKIIDAEKMFADVCS